MMEKIKIAVWLNEGYTSEVGGGFSYYDKMIQAIDDYQFDSSVELCFVTESLVSKKTFSKSIIELSYVPRKLPIRFFIRIVMIVPLIGKWLKRKYKRKENEWQKKEKKDIYNKMLLDSGVRIIYYLSQANSPFFDFPFIATNWDIGHCSTFAFPELIYNGNFEWRNHFYTQILPKALMVFAESEAGKTELLKYTNIDEKKIKVVPLFAGDCVNVKSEAQKEAQFLSKNHLEKQKFFFYPAQFWAHKNHVGLLQAFATFVEQYPNYKLVFTGSDKGNLKYIQSLVSELKLEKKVLFLGFLSIEQISILYNNATSLIMATYLGPSNMPPIEAMELGCPVICSDLKGHREILGNAAIYFNPLDKEELCNAMTEMVKNRSFYKKAIEKQNRHSLFKIENSIKKMNEYFKEIAIIRNCWK